jgi:hypothetical protein
MELLLMLIVGALTLCRLIIVIAFIPFRPLLWAGKMAKNCLCKVVKRNWVGLRFVLRDMDAWAMKQLESRNDEE